MLGLKYLRVPPTTFVIHYVNGQVRREGAGLSFYYFAPWSTLVAVPVGSADVPFAFSLATADFQAVTLQGQLTYRIADPRRAAALLDYSLGPDGAPRGDDHEKLEQRLVLAAQVLANGVAGGLTLREVLTSSESLTSRVLAGLRAIEAVTMLGVELLGLMVLAVRPTPEMGRALEAEAREALQKQADGAIYARRQNALEQERAIKETELGTEMAVVQKQREIREAGLAADVAAERQRVELVTLKADNERLEADARAHALEAVLGPVRTVDARTLRALMSGSGDARTLIAGAFQELAENAKSIGTLNVTPDLLSALLAAPATKKG